jgi:hypothetical protein
VTRLVRGAGLDAVSCESQVPAHELKSWKQVFLARGARGLESRVESEERELALACAKIGELMMRLELAESLFGKAGSRTSGRSPGVEGHSQPRHAAALSAHDDLSHGSAGAVERRRRLGATAAGRTTGGAGGPAPDVRPRAPGPLLAGSAEGRSRARPHDHRRPTPRDVGDGRDLVLYRARGLVLVLRSHRSLHRRAPRLAHGEARPSPGGAREVGSGW